MMEKPPARAGWLWVKNGFALFRKQPAEMSVLFVAYMFMMLAVRWVPFVGLFLQLVLIPVFSMAFMQACVLIEQGKKVSPGLLLASFRSPRLRPLLLLGVLYPVAATLAVAASSLVDGGVFWQVMSGAKEVDEEVVRTSNMSTAMLFAALVYTPAAMAFWHAAPLIVWHKMGVGKALFYSFFAVKRATGAFLVYVLSWVWIGGILPAIAVSIISLVFSPTLLMTAVLLPLSMVLTVVLFCSFYPTYTQVFGRPYSDDADSPQTGSDRIY